jgi:hypothetical protein
MGFGKKNEKKAKSLDLRLNFLAAKLPRARAKTRAEMRPRSTLAGQKASV